MTPNLTSETKTENEALLQSILDYLVEEVGTGRAPTRAGGLLAKAHDAIHDAAAARKRLEARDDEVELFVRALRRITVGYSFAASVDSHAAAIVNIAQKALEVFQAGRDDAALADGEEKT